MRAILPSRPSDLDLAQLVSSCDLLFVYRWPWVSGESRQRWPDFDLLAKPGHVPFILMKDVVASGYIGHQAITVCQVWLALGKCARQDSSQSILRGNTASSCPGLETIREDSGDARGWVCVDEKPALFSLPLVLSPDTWLLSTGGHGVWHPGFVGIPSLWLAGIAHP